MSVGPDVSAAVVELRALASELSALQARLNAEASRIGGLAHDLHARVERMEFLGPAASRFRAVVRRQHRAAQGYATELRELAADLRRAEHELDNRIDALRKMGP